MTQQIDDVIILGRGVPEQITDGRITVCVAGYSEQIGFVRLYPTRIDSPLNVWNIVSVEVERNPKDSRAESWKFPDSRSGWENINEHMEIKGELPRAERMNLSDALRTDCIADLNEHRLSLGIIRPNIRRVYLDKNEMHSRAYQPLFENIEHADIMTKRSHPLEPRLEYTCGPGCKNKTAHDQQLLDWGCYQWMIHHQGREQEIWRNLHIREDGWLHYFLVGNQANQRTSFMVINILRQKTNMVQMPLFATDLRTGDRVHRAVDESTSFRLVQSIN